jgi:hypothetical protein
VRSREKKDESKGFTLGGEPFWRLHHFLFSAPKIAGSRKRQENFVYLLVFAVLSDTTILIGMFSLTQANGWMESVDA